MKAVIVLLCLTGCATTYKANMRREAEWRVQACLGHEPELRGVHRSPFLRRQCLEESKAWCVSNGMEKDCGLGDVR